MIASKQKLILIFASSIIFAMLFLTGPAFGEGLCELLGHKKKIGKNLLTVRTTFNLHDLYFCEGYKLYDTRAPRTLLTSNLVDYEPPKLSPDNTKVAFIDSREEPTSYGGANYRYRLMLYTFAGRNLRKLVEEDRKQLHRFEWLDDNSLRYSYEYWPKEKDWYEVRLDRDNQ